MSHSPNKKYFKPLAKSKKQPKTRISDEYVIKLDRQKKNVFATLWQDITIVISHAQNLDLIDKQDTWSTYCNYGFFISDSPPALMVEYVHLMSIPILLHNSYILICHLFIHR